MSNSLVEKKQEYTIQLINVLTPLIYEGLQSIYQEVIKISTSDNILKNFQIFMQRIPKWNNEIINNETTRIINNTKSYLWLEDLIKATLKANIIILTYNPSVKQQMKVDPSFYQNVKINDFIHKIYIECARELWNNPYLFYHQYSPIELKRNQRDSIMLIKDCIREAIRKLLPLKHILHIFLGEEMETELYNDNFEKSISEVESRNLNKLIQKDLNQINNNNFPNEIIGGFNNDFNGDINNDSNGGFNDDSNGMIGGMIGGMNGGFNDDSNKIDNDETKLSLPDKNNEDTNTVGSKILKIINDKNIDLTDNVLPHNKLVNDSITSNNDINYNNVESETSVYNDKNDKFQEIFSNGGTKEQNKNLSEKNINKTKEKFFANYLNL